MTTSDPAEQGAARGGGFVPSILFFGAAGGAAPSLLELAGRAQAGELPGSGYYLAILIFASIGGIVALAYREAVRHKAFFLGVGAPALIVAGGSAVDSSTPMASLASAALPPAAAAPAPGPVAAPERPRFATGVYDALGLDRRAYLERLQRRWSEEP